ncbi:MAG: exodeoxyribonuclease VII large subunit [Candidatus Margulisbacteria bacterium]|jgi:exodeoxyribonuclease VII large subunit|nr:exodeoxyribonuclease VII large subunit [Candidatus Margulisiibacteriota bacterium]
MQALSVSALNDYLKELVNDDIVLNNLLVEGEISNFKKSATGGHWYFTLKDETAQIACIIFAGAAARLKYQPRDGERAQARGRLAVFNKRGTYSLQVYFLEQAGLGELAKRFELLKNKLSAEGLFAAGSKKPLPAYPRKVAVLAAPEGAAVHDIITVAGRRDPALEIHLYPTLVQGDAAAKNIIDNLHLAQDIGGYDAVVLARGGGSLEDLQPFNAEEVARAIAACRLPTISAVGHEVDFTLADLAADLRAATPSVAAELLVPDRRELSLKIAGFADFLRGGLESLFSAQQQELAYYGERLAELMQNTLGKYEEKTAVFLNRLNDLDPARILRRGFALVEKDSRPAALKDLQKDDIISVHLAGGSVNAQVREIYGAGS